MASPHSLAIWRSPPEKSQASKSIIKIRLMMAGVRHKGSDFGAVMSDEWMNMA